jgi:hypothetical protein
MWLYILLLPIVIIGIPFLLYLCEPWIDLILTIMFGETHRLEYDIENTKMCGRKAKKPK